MKKLLIIITVLGIMLVSVINAYAAQNISFDLRDVSCSRNRLVEIEVTAQCSKELSAATFEFTYDKSMFEFRSVKAADKNSTVKANELENSVKTVYLNTKGEDISNGKTIFTITLKALNEGIGYLDFTVSDCVDSDVKSMSVGKCTSAKITVSGSSSSSNNSKSGNSNSSGSKSSNGSADKSNGKSSRENESASSSQSSIDNLGTLNPISDKNTDFLIIGIALGSGAVIIVLLAFYIGKHSADKKNNTNDEGSDA